jgi:hypothetical protein
MVKIWYFIPLDTTIIPQYRVNRKILVKDLGLNRVGCDKRLLSMSRWSRLRPGPFQTRATGTQNCQKASHVGMDASFLATTRI